MDGRRLRVGKGRGEKSSTRRESANPNTTVKFVRSLGEHRNKVVASSLVVAQPRQVHGVCQ